MNYARQQGKSFRLFAPFVATMLVLTFTFVAVPTQAQTYKVLYKFGTRATELPSKARFTTTCRFTSRNFVIAAGVWGSSARPIPENFDNLRRLYELRLAKR